MLKYFAVSFFSLGLGFWLGWFLCAACTKAIEEKEEE